MDLEAGSGDGQAMIRGGGPRAPGGFGLSRATENKGSTARDHLANERTFLAWLRTAISVIALGVAIAKLSPDHGGITIGAVLLGLGLLVLVYSGRRYFEVESAFEGGQFMINTGGVVMVVAGVVLAAAACLALVLLL